MPEHVDKSKRGRNTVLSRTLLIGACVLIAAALAIAAYVVWGYLDAQNRYAHIETVAGLEVETENVVDSELTLENLHFDWDALRGLNPDTVGWIIVPGTHINYPIVQGLDNSYYLYHLFDESSSGTGAIFADYKGPRGLDGPNNMIYGHNMWDSSMFSDLIMYTSQDFFDEHTVVFLGTPARNYELRALTTLKIVGTAPVRLFDFESPADFHAYLDKLFVNPVTTAADFQETKATTPSVYSFVTCNTYDNNYRIVLSCVVVRSLEQQAPVPGDTSSTGETGTGEKGTVG
ncbi:MAG: class B sortase [Coriobacteriales bacterium]|jgi:sortase B|nr:class B sortase [Coriobacteriales bacterium]